MLLSPTTLICITFFTLTTATLKPNTPCIHGKRIGKNPNNPACGADSWCKPNPGSYGINGSAIDAPGTCEDFPQRCTLGGKGCGINGICTEQGYCKIAIPDNAQ